MATEIKFGTDGFRGIIADDFTFENVRKITVAISKYIKQNALGEKVLIGYDPRFMADKFAEFSSDLMKNAGFKVLLSARVVPTPVLAYAATVEAGCAGAIMFTASHNPKEYLGVKFIPSYGGPATKEMTDEIVSLIDNCDSAFDFSGQKGEIILKDFSEEYYAHIEKLIDFKAIKKVFGTASGDLKSSTAGAKFIYDGLYSASIGYFDTLLKRNGIEFKTCNLHHDPNFGGGLPEPKAKFMKHIKPGFLTFANDGDADRYGVIDETGEYISPNVVMAVLLKYLASCGHKGKMIKTVGVSEIVDITAKKLGIETITTPVGFKWLSEKMRENDTILAGEDSGGLSIGKHIPEKDGIFANLLILEAVSVLGKPLSVLKKEAIEFAEQEFFQDRVDIRLKLNEEKKVITEKFAAFNDFAGFKVYETLRIDGVKFFLKNDKGQNAGWVLMRESGTEPLLRFYIETSDMKNMELIKSFIAKNV